MNTYVNLNLFDKNIGRDNLRKANKNYSDIDEDDVSEADFDDDVEMDGGDKGGCRKKNKK